ncbi:hypothetical protein E4V42_04110 [Clostridium estertheticum]|uniref:Uncharacterized protein n=1 Tax=Clostridium estertheticum TaxID=238834 RepID=A0A5N7IXT5_9CLOT|nr:hypothetical protein [Clostridium estertheticum]MCB2360095.1 hypothetical protein [Clostridium estertheticum]MPQ30615.1 hypothetical protein [Clostridium estertheticum]MPQ61291.1 hypothetical protein [Clostridium estertheticum]
MIKKELDFDEVLLYLEKLPFNKFKEENIVYELIFSDSHYKITNVMRIWRLLKAILLKFKLEYIYH